jgi:hypothetical protein
MKKWSDKTEPLCMTSERGEVFFSDDETAHHKVDVAGRILEAFNCEIAFLLKTNNSTVKTFIEGEEFPSTEILISIHKVTSVSIHWLLTGEGTKYPNFKEHLTFRNETALLGLA